MKSIPIGALGILSILSSNAFSQSFVPLGDLDGGNFSSQSAGISADGATVIGLSDAGYNHAITWNSSTGMTDLGTINNASGESRAHASSHSGDVIVGTDRSNGRVPFIWTADNGMSRIALLEGIAFGVSGNGNIVVGQADVGPQTKAFRWSSDSGVSYLPSLPGGESFSFARSTSSDGTISVGQSASDRAPTGEAVIWLGNSPVALGDLPGGPFNSQAFSISSDGSTVVGYGTSDLGQEAVIWTEELGLTSLSTASGPNRDDIAHDVSGDGSIIVGKHNGRACFWNSNFSLFYIDDYLESVGLGPVIAEWRLDVATGVSDDGLTITGYGLNSAKDREAWVITIPSPTSAFLFVGFLAINRRSRR